MQLEVFRARLELDDTPELENLVRWNTGHPVAGDLRHQPVQPLWHAAFVSAGSDQQRFHAQLLVVAAELDVVDNPARAFVLVDDLQVEQLADDLDMLEGAHPWPPDVIRYSGTAATAVTVTTAK